MRVGVVFVTSKFVCEQSTKAELFVVFAKFGSSSFMVSPFRMGVAGTAGALWAARHGCDARWLLIHLAALWSKHLTTDYSALLMALQRKNGRHVLHV
eukprot:2082637-Amphidinium_carterae.1